MINYEQFLDEYVNGEAMNKKFEGSGKSFAQYKELAEKIYNHLNGKINKIKTQAFKISHENTIDSDAGMFTASSTQLFYSTSLYLPCILYIRYSNDDLGFIDTEILLAVVRELFYTTVDEDFDNPEYKKITYNQTLYLTYNYIVDNKDKLKNELDMVIDMDKLQILCGEIPPKSVMDNFKTVTFSSIFNKYIGELVNFKYGTNEFSIEDYDNVILNCLNFDDRITVKHHNEIYSECYRFIEFLQKIEYCKINNIPIQVFSEYGELNAWTDIAEPNCLLVSIYFHTDKFCGCSHNH